MNGNRSEFEQRMINSLQADKEKANQESGQVSEESMASAIRFGVEYGRQHSRNRKRSRVTIQMGVAAACVLVLLTACIRVSPAFAELMREVPGLNGVVELIKGDQTLENAMSHDFLQPVNKSVSDNGYTLSVEGIMADQQRLVIFYTREGPDVNDNISPIDYKITDSNGNELKGLISWGHSFIGKTESEIKDMTSVSDRMDITLSDGIVMPDVVTFSMKLGNEWLAMDIVVDHRRFEQLEEQITVNRTFEVGGQTFTLEKTLITPLQATVTIRREPDDNIRVNSFIRLALLDEKGRRWETKGGYGMLDEGTTTLTFQSNYFEKPKHLRLVADGLMLSPKGQKLVINTETGKTLETPDDRIQLANVQQTTEGIKLTIEVSRLKQLEENYGYWLFEYKGKFHDRSGTEYPLVEFDGAQSSSRGNADGTGGTYEAYYNIPDKPYKQPLTFELYQYPGYVEQPVDVVIK
ncbi:DUF4179 domain-containing protein [Paenibacillus glycanilyticus]|uniref:DUF4179 domain-containing protein n=1 Tax=Paenibacillus glycanilyticus TaxID=126569 RepID=A0ABQ6GK62_9BACL|nr:DUF4179 domain-containing protein [Paenibacillus glycanilyticus]GLX71319.1 hypothetical protein MU1_56690 [Paenibacillus glycanilyticus]